MATIKNIGEQPLLPTDDPYGLDSEIEQLRSQLSDCTLAREQLAAELAVAREMRAASGRAHEAALNQKDEWRKRAEAAEAALAEAVKERDELAAHWLAIEGAAFIVMSNSEPCDDADFLIVKAVDMEELDYTRQEEPARAHALLNVVRTAETLEEAHNRYTYGAPNDATSSSIRIQAQEERRVDTANAIVAVCEAIRALKDSTKETRRD